MSELIGIITSDSPEVKNRSLDAFCRAATTEQLLNEAKALDEFRRESSNLYQRVRAQFFLYSIHRFHLPQKPDMSEGGSIPFVAQEHVMKRRFSEAIEELLTVQAQRGPSAATSSALAAAYHKLAFQTLAAQVRRSVRAVRGNQWMSRIGHPEDHPLKIRRELVEREHARGVFPILREETPVRMDLTHSGWSDIFFLGMDFPEGARVLNVSIDLAVRGGGSVPKPPLEACFRVIDEPVLRLTSIDLNASADITSIDEVFDFARDYLGLLKAGVIAAGLVPPGMEGAHQPLADLLRKLTGRDGHGFELVTRVRGIPKGSRLAVSTNLLACIISVGMRATGQIRAMTGGLEERERRLVAARAILGEWLGGSGGGWQDSGGVWPGMKTIQGVAAEEGDPEFGASRGCLLPQHHVLGPADVSKQTRDLLQESLVLVHGGMAQDVGPILEMVTEKYLLRSESEWQGRRAAIQTFDDILGYLRSGDIAAIGKATEQNFFGPIQTIIPWATNLYTESLINQVREEFGKDFLGFWMLGGMAGGGMGFIFEPKVRERAQARLETIMRETKHRLERAAPFAMEPVVYDFAINDRGTWAELLTGASALMPPAYYTQALPGLLRREVRSLTDSRRAELEHFSSACRESPDMAGAIQQLFDVMLPSREEESRSQPSSLMQVLEQLGFDRTEHEQIRADLKSGRIGLAQNRLPASTDIRDVQAADINHMANLSTRRFAELGLAALRSGAVAAVTLAGGVGSRWTRGAGAVKALNPFAKFADKHRSFLEVHLAKSRQTGRQCGASIPHVITTSYLTHEAISDWLAAEQNYGYDGPLLLSLGRSVGLRLIPMARDLEFAWEETPQQLLDEQKQKVRESLHHALIGWARAAGEGNDYTDNLPMQCLHPTGHWYEIPNLLRNGTLLRLLEIRPQLKYLMVHNIDTLGANLDPVILGWFIQQESALMFEVIARQFDDQGGGLASVNARPRLVEGLALPSEQVGSGLSFYNSATCWIDIDQLLRTFALTRADLKNTAKINEEVRLLAARMPTYITLKDVKKRWGKGQEDVYPVAQFEKLWGDMTALPDVTSRFAVVSRRRGQQLKEPAQLDGWLRDGTAEYVNELCDWGR
jgi:UTP--glucose-1-phosphate uridylyltransferase